MRQQVKGDLDSCLIGAWAIITQNMSPLAFDADFVTH